VNVVPMVDELLIIANPMIGESSLPNFSLATDDRPEGMRVSAFDELNRMFQRYTRSGSQQKMYVLGHDDERVQFIPALATVSVKSLQEQADVRLYDERWSSLPRRERHEVGSRRGDQSSRLQKQTSAAESRVFCLG
jgi:hypothetical protein